MANYKILKLKPFVIEGANRTYEIPAMNSLNFDQGAEIALIQDENDFKKRWRKIKKFLLDMAPELESEGLADIEYVTIYSSYDAYNRNANAAETGESSAS